MSQEQKKPNLKTGHLYKCIFTMVSFYSYEQALKRVQEEPMMFTPSFFLDNVIDSYQVQFDEFSNYNYSIPSGTIFLLLKQQENIAEILVDGNKHWVVLPEDNIGIVCIDDIENTEK